MALNIVPAPSVIQGVSQLTPSVRSPSHAIVSDNTWPTFADSLQKRPPTQRIAQVLAGQPGSLTVHGINNGPGFQYIVAARNGVGFNIDVMDLDGVSYPVYANTDFDPPDFSYIRSTGTADSALRFLTVQDYTFVLNRERPVTVSTTALSAVNDPLAIATLFVKVGDYKSRYTLRFKHPSIAGGAEQSITVFTWDGANTANDPGCLIDPNNAAKGTIRTQDIAQSFKDKIDLLAIAGLTVYITTTNESTQIVVGYVSTIPFTYFRAESGGGNTYMVGYTDEVESRQDLPKVSRDGYIVKVRSDQSQDSVDYYIKFEADNPSTTELGTGRWEECAAPGITTTLNPSSMPHALIRRTDTTGAVYFTFESIDWETRQAGDEDTNPLPAFASSNDPETGLMVLRYIADLAFFKNRLAFINDESVTFSEAGRYFSFFRTSTQFVLDADPLHALTGDRSGLFAAATFNRQLVLFSENAQYVVEGEPILTPTTIQTAPVMSVTCMKSCHPVAGKRSLLFAHSRGDFSAMLEMFPVDAANIGFDSVDVSVHIPKYIDGDIVRLIHSTQEDVVFALSDVNPQYLYVFKSYTENQERLQSSWFRWDFGASVVGAAIFDSSLYLLVQRELGVDLERIDLSPGADTRWTHLDRRLSSDSSEVIRVYDPNSRSTLITVPYDVHVVQQVAVVSEDGHWFQLINNPQTNEFVSFLGAGSSFTPQLTFEVLGDAETPDVFIGFLYPFEHTVDRPSVWMTANSGKIRPRDGEHFVVRGRAHFRDSGPVTVQVENPAELDDAEFTPQVIGDSTVGTYPSSDFDASFYVGGRSDNVRVTFYSLSPFPVNLESIEWSIDFEPSGRFSPS